MNNKKNNQIDRYVVEAELEFLANLLSKLGDDCETAMIDRYGAEAEQYFINKLDKLIYSVMRELAEKKKTIDCVSIAMLLESKQLNSVDCITRLTTIHDKSDYSLPLNVRKSSADTQFAIMHDYWIRRRLQQFVDNAHSAH